MPGLLACRPAQWHCGERGAWRWAPGQTVLVQAPDELIETVATEEGLVLTLDDHQRHAAVTGSRHTLGIVDPALVDFLGVLPDVGDRLVVIETVDPVHVLLHVIRPVTLRWILGG